MENHKGRINKISKNLVHCLFCYLEPFEIFQYSKLSKHTYNAVKTSQEFADILAISKIFSSNYGKFNLFWDDIKYILIQMKEHFKDRTLIDFQHKCFSYFVNKFYFENANSFSFNFHLNVDNSGLNTTQLQSIFDSIFRFRNKTEKLVLKLGKCEDLILSKFLSNNIKTNSTVTELQLSSMLENSAFNKLIKSIRYSFSIRKLEILIKGNGVPALNKLIKSLSINTSLQELRISLKLMNFNNSKTLEYLLLASKSLEIIHILDSYLSEHIMMLFVKPINLNQALRKFYLNSTISVHFILEFFTELNADHMEEVSLNSESYLFSHQLNEFFKKFFMIKSKKNYVELGDEFIKIKDYFENYSEFLKENPSYLYKKSSSIINLTNQLPQLKNLIHVSQFELLVKKLYLHDILLQDSDLKTLSLFLERSKVLLSLTLSYIRLKDRFIVLEKGLIKNSSITSLSLIYNEFLGVDMDKISNFLSKSTCIKEFNLSYASLGKISSMEIANSIKRNSSLETLKFCRIQTKKFSHFMTLFKGIYQSPSIEEIYFQYNQTVAKKENLLANVMKGNKTIRHIDFGSVVYLFKNSVFDDSVEIIRM